VNKQAKAHVPEFLQGLCVGGQTGVGFSSSGELSWKPYGGDDAKHQAGEVLKRVKVHKAVVGHPVKNRKIEFELSAVCTIFNGYDTKLPDPFFAGTIPGEFRDPRASG
jgi:hypothetical protein